MSKNASNSNSAHEAVGGLIEGIVVDVLAHSDVHENIRSGAQYYKKYSLAKSGIELGFHIATKNYVGAALVVTNHVIGEKVGTPAADLILAKGGFSARLQLDTQLRVKQSQMLAGTFQMHESLSLIRHYNEELYWGAKHAHRMGELGMAAVAMSDGCIEQANEIAPTVGPRMYERLGIFERDAIYRGTWEQNDREGFGVLDYPKFGSYAGSWVNGIPMGYGRIDYQDGSFYAGELARASNNRVLGVSRKPDGTLYAGEHKAPFHAFPDGDSTDKTAFLPNGYGVQITDDDVQHATWRSGELEHELITKERHQAEIHEDIMRRGQAPLDFGVRAAEWRLKEAQLNSVWGLLQPWDKNSASAMIFQSTF